MVALYEVQRANEYRSPVWNVAEYLALFAIVTLHEFGHSLACRQVGGNADRIVLWPLGGVAYVDPPQRPGATLWSIAAGPLVNVALVPCCSACCSLGRSAGPRRDVARRAAPCLRAVAFINFGLLVFNLLPVYPLDGGQILRSLLWFVLGRARSLTAASVVGFVGVLGLLALALRVGVRLDRDPRRVRRHELLAGVPALARAVAAREPAAPPGLRLPVVPVGAAARRLLGLRPRAGRPSTRSRRAPAARPAGRSSARRAAPTAGARARSASG